MGKVHSGYIPQVQHFSLNSIDQKIKNKQHFVLFWLQPKVEQPQSSQHLPSCCKAGLSGLQKPCRNPLYWVCLINWPRTVSRIIPPVRYFIVLCRKFHYILVPTWAKSKAEHHQAHCIWAECEMAFIGATSTS